MSGLLIERKRRWLAVQALADKSLRDYRKVIVGDGHLRSELFRRWSAARLPGLLNRWWERCHENAV
jgi:hypothetical protein